MVRTHFASQPHQFLRKADKHIRGRILERIKKLAAIPFPSDAKRVHGWEKCFRIRVGNLRVLYVVLSKEVLLIVRIDKRSRVYG